MKGSAVVMRCGDGGLYLMGVGAELEKTLKNESRNETENGHFCKSEGRVPFFQK
jgi:hypothetical protein